MIDDRIHAGPRAWHSMYRSRAPIREVCVCVCVCVCVLDTGTTVLCALVECVCAGKKPVTGFKYVSASNM